MELLQYAVWRMNKKITKKENISKFSALNWFCIPFFAYSWVLIGLFVFSVTENKFFWIVEAIRQYKFVAILVIYIFGTLLYLIIHQVFKKQNVYNNFEQYKGKFTQLSKSKRIIYEAYFFISFLLFFIYNVSAGWAYKEVYM